MDGVHLCMVRLELLRLNTMPPLDPLLLTDITRLQSLQNVELRELGRLPYPMLREKNAPAASPDENEQLEWHSPLTTNAGVNCFVPM